MSNTKPASPTDQSTPVDEVRRVREKISREAGNDIGRLIERARAVAAEVREKLGLKRPSD